MGGLVQSSKGLAFGCILALLAACSQSETPNLMNIRANTEGPDEFTILPNKPLAVPDSFAQLPSPTPGGRNRADPTPEADAFAALGGNAGALGRTGPDGALVSRVSRYGVAPSIRSVLASEDLAFREANDGRFLERLFNVNVYFRAYEDQSLDKHLELERFRRAGVWTPAAPPEERDFSQ